MLIDELRGGTPGARVAAAWRGFDERTSILEVAAEQLPELGVAEDLFVLAARGRAIRGLGDLSAAVLTSKLLGPAVGKARTFRVIARMAGRHPFRRVDAQQVVASAVRKRFPRIRQVDEGGEAELWLSIVGSDALLGVRLPGREDTRRTLPASLKPSVARAMALLSTPRQEDVVLDPLCGVGTLLIERGHAAPFGELSGGDDDRSAVTRARANLRAAGLQAPVKEWDARAVPLADASVDVVLTNPPFGKQMLLEDADAFYQDIVGEIARLLRPGGRLVLITSQRDAFEVAVRTAQLRVRRRVNLLLRGEPAAIYVCAKVPA